MYSETILNFNEPINVLRQNKFEVKNNISPITTLKCILDNYSADKKIIALNFANAIYAGGGYILGGSAQEESMCRASMLYYTIKTQKRFYIKNRLHILPDYTDTMIYSHNVPLIRNENGELLDKFISCDFITCPAVNRTFAKFIFSDKNINNKMSVRIKRIISLAVSENPDIIILDEPINALDEAGAKQVHEILEEQKKRGALIIIACHDKEELEMLSDEIIEIYEGRIVAQEKV